MGILKQARWLRSQWHAVYRHNGGVGSVARCVAGSLRQRAATPLKTDAELSVDCLTFSVVPQLTMMWATFMTQSINMDVRRIIIGDCSGGFRNGDRANNVFVYPLLNHVHGLKLDWFMRSVCRAKYVIVSDDDVIWANSKPWRWALETLESDDQIPVVSLRPRGSPTANLRDKIPQAMGSYCLVIRRETWLKEQLSFQVIHPEHSQHEWIYDTADFANLTLIERGYSIPIAPQTIQDELVGFEGVSHGILRIQKHQGDIRPIMADHQLKQEKTLHAIYAIRGVQQAAGRLPTSAQRYIPTSTVYLDKAQHFCETTLPQERVQFVRQQVDTLLNRLQAA